MTAILAWFTASKWKLIAGGVAALLVAAVIGVLVLKLHAAEKGETSALQTAGAATEAAANAATQTKAMRADLAAFQAFSAQQTAARDTADKALAAATAKRQTAAATLATTLKTEEIHDAPLANCLALPLDPDVLRQLPR